MLMWTRRDRRCVLVLDEGHTHTYRVRIVENNAIVRDEPAESGRAAFAMAQNWELDEDRTSLADTLPR